MCDPNVQTFDAKSYMLRKFSTDLFSIYVSINSPQRFEGREFICYFRTKIPGMPDFITVVKVLKTASSKKPCVSERRPIVTIVQT